MIASFKQGSDITLGSDLVDYDLILLVEAPYGFHILVLWLYFYFVCHIYKTYIISISLSDEYSQIKPQFFSIFNRFLPPINLIYR